VKISALQNDGIEKLKEEVAIVSLFSQDERENKTIPNLRHRTVLERIHKSLEEMLTGFKEGVPCELIAIDTKEVIEGFDELLGNTKKVDILDNIFERFCVGK
jgi:tRNA modification GTPase